MEATTNRFQLKALLLDAITFEKFGQHLAPNFKQAKNNLCDQTGQKRGISNINLIRLIGKIYEDNNMAPEFEAILNKFKIADRIYN